MIEPIEDVIGHEVANEAACMDTAVENGHTVDEALLCEDGDVGCPNCPFLPPSQRLKSSHGGP
jgi:hypothetical protein